MPDYFSIVDRSWSLLRYVSDAHTAVYRATGGRIGRRMPGVPPVLLLEHVGAKSGRKRTMPLVYMPDAGDFVIVGAKGGHPKNPAWLYNLRANPDTEIQVGPRRLRVHAREAVGEERQRLWERALEYNRHWRYYSRRTNRTIPVVILAVSDTPADRPR
ncbi:nitroreductase family deazaflavin-dependent oxidoreductase [Nocardia sp. BMG51109]|uniref:nitroreductase family deazaflavin-dependent oxidoreductase n=1 Tax=Nocardia sp. BMG51109 TaxID=1056816 RepID=UPI000462F9B8|nr:nitroreductase family deazaflavin-dependent oxidoreductase [Nocardia sp. BMG51109]